MQQAGRVSDTTAFYMGELRLIKQNDFHKTGNQANGRLYNRKIRIKMILICIQNLVTLNLQIFRKKWHHT
jgi:hypothetical protein